MRMRHAMHTSKQRIRSKDKATMIKKESWKKIYKIHTTKITTQLKIKINHDKVAFFIPRLYIRFFENVPMLFLRLTDPLHTSLHYLFSPSSHLPSGHLYPFYSADFCHY